MSELLQPINNILTFFTNLFLSPLRFLWSVVKLLGVILKALAILLGLLLEYFNLAYNAIPNFLKAFFALLFAIRLFKWLGKRAMSSHRAHRASTNNVLSEKSGGDK